MDNRVFVHKAPLGRADDIARAVETLLTRLPAMDRLAPQSRVLLKPNLLAKHAPERAVTTHPDVLRGVVLALQKRGVQDILIADSPGGRYSSSIMRGVYKACGVEAVCAETGAQAYTACESGHRGIPGGKRVKEFTLLRPALEYDFIINLPKLKTHVLTTLSGAVKNLFGLVPGLQKAEFHMRFPEKEAFGGMLVDLCETVRADIHLVDGVLGMEGDGPGSGTPRQCDLLLAGEDPYSLDLALCRYMGIEPISVPTLADAAGRGLCPAIFDEALLVGDGAVRQPISGFVLPASYSGRVNFEQKLPAFLRPAAAVATQWVAPRPVIHKRQCIGCGKCAEICPEQVVTVTGGKAKIARMRCIRCFCCHEICPVKAIGIRRVPLFQL